VFAQVTDEQLAALQLKTGMQRMDSTLIASNIRQMSRLHLLVEVLHRVWRLLDEEDRDGYAEQFAPYVRISAGHYCSQVRLQEIPAHLEAIGQLMRQLVVELEGGYAGQQAYQVLQRVFEEHFVVEEDPETERCGLVRPKPADALSASGLHSPDDLEATYRNKRGWKQCGYVANVAETCDPDNPVQLITHVQVAPNSTDDQQMLVQAVPELEERTDLETLWTDGGFNGPEAEAVLEDCQVTHVATAIRGRSPLSDRLDASSFDWETDEAGRPVTVTCPGGQRVAVTPGRRGPRHSAYFSQAGCEGCPLTDQCPTDVLRRRPVRALHVTTRQIQIARLRQRSQHAYTAEGNLRAAIESTVRSLKHPFGGRAGKLPVRGQRRVAMVVVSTALMVNLRRIWRYERGLGEEARSRTSPFSSFLLSRLQTRCRYLKDAISEHYPHSPSPVAGVFLRI